MLDQGTVEAVVATAGNGYAGGLDGSAEVKIALGAQAGVPPLVCWIVAPTKPVGEKSSQPMRKRAEKQRQREARGFKIMMHLA